MMNNRILKLSEVNRVGLIEYCMDRQQKYLNNNDAYIAKCSAEQFGAMYDELCKPKYNLRVKNDGRMTVYEGSERIKYFSDIVEPTNDITDLEWEMQHEVYCKTEWAVRAPDTAKKYGYKIQCINC